MLSGRDGFGRSCKLSREQVLEQIPAVRSDGLRGGVLYYDGQFDDARLLINLAQTAAQHGAAMLNYLQVVRTLHTGGKVCGVLVRDAESGREAEVRGRCVINATGAFCDALRRSDDPACQSLVAPSQGAHVVLDRSFLGGDTALMLPRTDDARVLFAIPWHGHVLLGTTDTAIAEASLEPRPFEDEVDFLLRTAGRHLSTRPALSDVRSAFAGIRPLVRNGKACHTSTLSREHVIDVAPSGLITIAGGKWTTYRAMAQECIDVAARVGSLAQRPCVTGDLRIAGADDEASIRQFVERHPSTGERLDQALPVTPAHVRWAARHEAARTVDDVLARRTRALHLNARAAMRMAEQVAQLLAEELHRDEAWQREQVQEFRALARRYAMDGLADREPEARPLAV
jgi:glycerol-3-phosphate dehydrogenase